MDIETATLNAIAIKHGIGTLEVQNRDRSDFHDIYVSELREMLSEAYQAGLATGRRQSDLFSE